MNYDGKIFKAVANSLHGDVTADTVFYYYQEDNILTGEYHGGKIRKGQLIGTVDEDGNLAFSYQQVDHEGHIKTGVCNATPEILPGGKIRLHEQWQWTVGEKQTGTSIIEEM